MNSLLTYFSAWSKIDMKKTETAADPSNIGNNEI